MGNMCNTVAVKDKWCRITDILVKDEMYCVEMADDILISYCHITRKNI